jgi:hypothetical protein
MAKQLNRNAFSEKLIHRYVMERYYFGDKKCKNGLLPEKYHGKEINLIVPEEANESDKAYRADLSLYFKNSDKRIPVEIKWTARDLTKENQINHLKNNDGFVVSFENDVDQMLNGIPNIEIDYEDFKNWMSLNVSKLTRESISEKTAGKLLGLKQYWLVFLRGESSQENFKRMLKASSKTPFWAFRQDRTALGNILNIQKGDTVVFLFGKGVKQGQGYSGAPGKELILEGAYQAKVTVPYYMVLDQDKGTFFESDKTLPINRRIWPHFIDFKLIKPSYAKAKVNFGKQGKLGAALSRSTNYGGGTPVQLSLAEYESLSDCLNVLLGKESNET